VRTDARNGRRRDLNSLLQVWPVARTLGAVTRNRRGSPRAALEESVMSIAAPATQPHAATHAAHAGTREYLSFRLGAEEYGIDILRVQEIRGYEAPTRIANAPDFIKGVVNLRGVIVPIVDMRLRFALADVQYNAFTVVIILNIAGRTVGMVVDSVSDVLELDAGEIRPAPEFNGAIDASYITGLGSVKTGDTQRMLILMDIEHLMQSPEMGLMDLGA
jgi:purine-binding chemotaxis protein CheW